VILEATAMSDLAAALQDYLAARAEVEYWQGCCESAVATHRGHPLDQEKLHQRRVWEQRLANSETWLAAALRVCEVEGHA
jgi:glutathione S-transferase